MSAATAMNGLMQALSAFWNERNQRERNMLTAAAAVIVLGLLYALLIDPAIGGRADLAKKLPALRQQAAEVQALAKDAASLTTQNAAPPPVVSKESIESSLARKGLKAQNVAMTGEMAKLQLNGVSFAATVDWLNEMQRTARLSVVDANIEAQAQIDTVNATLTLRQQRGGQAQ